VQSKVRNIFGETVVCRNALGRSFCFEDIETGVEKKIIDCLFCKLLRYMSFKVSPVKQEANVILFHSLLCNKTDSRVILSSNSSPRLLTENILKVFLQVVCERKGHGIRIKLFFPSMTKSFQKTTKGAGV